MLTREKRVIFENRREKFEVIFEYTFSPSDYDVYLESWTAYDLEKGKEVEIDSDELSLEIEQFCEKCLVDIDLEDCYVDWYSGMIDYAHDMCDMER